MCGHYLFAKAYNDLFHVINGNKVGFVWQFSLEHFDLVFVP